VLTAANTSQSIWQHLLRLPLMARVTTKPYVAIGNKCTSQRDGLLKELF
jgi:hypothetical protein